MFQNWKFYTFTAKSYEVQKMSLNDMTLFCEGFLQYLCPSSSQNRVNFFCNSQEGHGQNKEVDQILLSLTRCGVVLTDSILFLSNKMVQDNSVLSKGF